MIILLDEYDTPMQEAYVDGYWANTSSNSVVGKLLREANSDIKQKFEDLFQGKSLVTPLDEQIVYSQLDDNEQAIWSLLLASGYLKVLSYEEDEETLKDTVLVEICFVDDKDDAEFYKQNKTAIAKAIANSVSKYGVIRDMV